MALMGLMLSLFLILKYVSKIIFHGPLNFSIEILFWIINGIIFGPLYGPLFSIICDTFMTFFISGIAYWMIEYAIIPPLISLLSWVYIKIYQDKKLRSIILSCLIIALTIAFSITIFYFQLLNNNFKYDGFKKISSISAFVLIAILLSVILCFTIMCLILFKIKQDWKFIRWIYYLSLILLIVIIFRWILGPYAFVAYYKRFVTSNFDIGKKYSLTLFGIVTKSYLTIPLTTIVMIPILNILNQYNFQNWNENKFK